MPKTFLIDPGQNPLEMPEIYERKQRSKRMLYLMAGLVIAGMIWLVFKPKPTAAEPTETLEYTPTATNSATPTDNPQLSGATAIADIRERNQSSATPNMPPTWTPQPRQIDQVPVTVVVTRIVERQVPVPQPVQVTVPVPVPVTVVVTATPTSTPTQMLPVYAWRVMLPAIVGGYNQPPVSAYPPP